MITLDYAKEGIYMELLLEFLSNFVIFADELISPDLESKKKKRIAVFFSLFSFLIFLSFTLFLIFLTVGLLNLLINDFDIIIAFLATLLFLCDCFLVYKSFAYSFGIVVTIKLFMKESNIN